VSASSVLASILSGLAGSSDFVALLVSDWSLFCCLSGAAALLVSY
jgi:hypothetical protein